ncbi:MAG: hypothetical protein KIT84_07550 [Labilithrix sp.]|nr:hypothetical protein [Labilithrix sp.]MCW5810850.1 hypothetical protein [Labilithrix sp.]
MSESVPGVVVAIAAVSVVESIGYFGAPFVYARLACFSLPPRRIHVGPRARAALASPCGSPFRAGAERGFEVARLEVPPRFETDEVIVYFDLARARAVARLTSSWWRKKALGAARVEVVATHEGIELRTKFLPYGLLAIASLGLVMPWYFAALSLGVGAACFALFALAAVASWFFMRAQIEVALDTVHDVVAGAVASLER